PFHSCHRLARRGRTAHRGSLRGALKPPIAHLVEGGVLDDLAEVDHRDLVVEGDLPRVDVREEVEGVLDEAELRVVALDLPLGQLADRLDVDQVDDRGEDLLARTVPVAHRHPDQLTLLVLVALVAEPDGRRLASLAELVDEQRGVEVQREHGASCAVTGGPPPWRWTGSPSPPAVAALPCRAGAPPRGGRPGARPRTRPSRRPDGAARAGPPPPRSCGAPATLPGRPAGRTPRAWRPAPAAGASRTSTRSRRGGRSGAPAGPSPPRPRAARPPRGARRARCDPSEAPAPAGSAGGSGRRPSGARRAPASRRPPSARGGRGPFAGGYPPRQPVTSRRRDASGSRRCPRTWPAQRTRAAWRPPRAARRPAARPSRRAGRPRPGRWAPPPSPQPPGRHHPSPPTSRAPPSRSCRRARAPRPRRPGPPGRSRPSPPPPPPPPHPAP